MKTHIAREHKRETRAEGEGSSRRRERDWRTMGAKGMKTKFTALCVKTRDHIHYLCANLKSNLRKRKEILTFAEKRCNWKSLY